MVKEEMPCFSGALTKKKGSSEDTVEGSKYDLAGSVGLFAGRKKARGGFLILSDRGTHRLTNCYRPIIQSFGGKKIRP